ncbi:MAG: DUF3307 domain-containing protein, partial [Deltaproteobacteria bacterium]
MIFWKILLAHLLTDFVLQPDSLAENKGKIKALLLHGAIFFLLSNVSILPTLSFHSVIALGCLSAFHGVVDYLKNRIQRCRGKNFWIYFLGDQVIHFLAIGGVVLLLEEDYYALTVETLVHCWSDPATFLIASFFVLIIFGGSFFIGA